MAVTKKGSISPKVLKEMKEAFLKQSEKLWKEHVNEAVEILEDSEEKLITINFKVTMDFTETSPKLKTAIRFTKSFTDEKVDEFDDPNQLALGKIQDEAKE
jgi:hypothetical protein